MEIHNKDVAEHIKTLPDKSINLIFSDFPYALGSEWHYVNGKLELKGQGSDFMNKWDFGSADWWRSFCKEMYRVMKFGGYVAFFSIDRQAFAFQSFMVEAGFEICQTLHWLKISNFPKSSDCEKQILNSIEIELEKLGYENIEWE